MSSAAERNKKSRLKRKREEHGQTLHDSRAAPQRILDCARDTQSGIVKIPARLLSAMNLELESMGENTNDAYSFSYRNIREMPSELQKKIKKFCTSFLQNRVLKENENLVSIEMKTGDPNDFSLIKYKKGSSPEVPHRDLDRWREIDDSIYIAIIVLKSIDSCLMVNPLFYGGGKYNKFASVAGEFVPLEASRLHKPVLSHPESERELLSFYFTKKTKEI